MIYQILQAGSHVELAGVVQAAIQTGKANKREVVLHGGVCAAIIHHRDAHGSVWWGTWFYQAITT